MPAKPPTRATLPAPEGTQAISHAVFEAMAATDARLERFAWLGDGLAAAIWHRKTQEEITTYSQPGHHTLSCYLGGGYRTERSGVAPGRYGAPRMLCTLPDWHESNWVVRDELRLLHVYFMPEHFTRRAVLELDREPRTLTLADRTYFENARLVQLCESLVGTPWQGADNLLLANEITHDTLSELLRAQAVARTDVRLRGGLSAAVRRRLAEYIEQNLAQPLTLGTLAQLACMSEFHLARMFRVSFGMPPSAWIAQRRIERARTLLKTTALPLQQVADACGYADLSHFSHRFSAALGAPPGRFRQATTASG